MQGSIFIYAIFLVIGGNGDVLPFYYYTELSNSFASFSAAYGKEHVLYEKKVQV